MIEVSFGSPVLRPISRLPMSAWRTFEREQESGFCTNWIAAQAWWLATRPSAVTEDRSENSWCPVTRMASSTPSGPRGW